MALATAAVEATLRRSPAQAVFRWRGARRLTVLTYHDIHAAGRFEQHLDYLIRAMHPVSLDEVLEAFSA